MNEVHGADIGAPASPATRGTTVDTTPDTPCAGTLYERVGGHAALEIVVEDLYVRILADDELAPFFTGVSLPRVKGRQVEFFAAALGGPGPYTGPGMKRVHQGRGITRHHFDCVAGHLAQALHAAGTPRALTAEIIAAVAPLADDIISPSLE
ncbi:group I truncated hemoglobin [Nocardia niwae]|uniref:Group 1 truncated hemoglobin n=1 Tax=Nocardia niwae TaxID=626084 RepID=A0ABV2X7X4_9NOCA|nr:group 1 truncated hemoglobin [Nocardia niwae]